MRRLTLTALLIVFTACRRTPKTIIEDEPAALAQTVAMGQPEHAAQLKEGFFGIEDGTWRWTGKRFSAVLRAPLRASVSGCKLVFKFSYPEPVAAKLGTVKLEATVAGHRLPIQTYTKPDSYVYEVPIPAAWVQQDTVPVEFQLDKALPPSGAEHRELGLIATSIGLRPW